MAIDASKLLSLSEVARQSGVSRPSVRSYATDPRAEQFKVYPRESGRPFVLYKKGMIHFAERMRNEGFSRRGRQKKKRKPGPKKDTPNLLNRNVVCPYCDGTGIDEVIEKKNEVVEYLCEVCDGKGKVRKGTLNRVIAEEEAEYV